MPQGDPHRDPHSHPHSDEVIHFDWRRYAIVLVSLVAGTAALIGVWSASINNHNSLVMSDKAFIIPLTLAMPSEQPDAAAAGQASGEGEAETDQLVAHEEAGDDAPPAMVEVEDVVAGLQEETPFGPLPVRGEDGQSAFQAYQAPPAEDVEAPTAARPNVAIVVRNFGLSQRLSEQAVKSLPRGTTFALSPYAGGDVMALVRMARQAGHEVWLDLPLPTETDAGVTDTGPVTLQPDQDENTNNKRLLTAMGVAPGYAGLIVAQDSPFMADPMFKSVVIETAQERGVALAVDGSALKAPLTGVYTGLHPATPDNLASVYQGLYGKGDGMAISIDLTKLSINAVKALAAGFAKDGKGQIAPLSRLVPTPAPLDAAEEAPAAAADDHH